MDWVLLTYGVIFGTIIAYLLTLWQRVRQAARDTRKPE